VLEAKVEMMVLRYEVERRKEFVGCGDKKEER
jgi:hypothetical protein